MIVASWFLWKEEALTGRNLPKNLRIASMDVLWYQLWWNSYDFCFLVSIKGALSGLRQFWVSENPLKMMKNAFYFTLKPHFVLKIFKFLSWLFGHVEKTAWLER